MHPYEHIQLRLTDHAHKQYCDRVELIAYDTLLSNCIEQLKQKDYGHNKKGLMHLSGVWWRTQIDEDKLIFITCYGKTEWNLASGIGWAERHNDHISLKNLI